LNFIDLGEQQRRIKPEIDAAIQKVLNHGQYIMGPEVRELEQELAAYVGVRHAVGCASGTDALLMSLMAYGVGPGDAIFTTPFTFFATAEVISLLGATPVFVDIDPVTYNIDPGKLEKAIIAMNSGDASLHPLPTVDTCRFSVQDKSVSGASVSSTALDPKGIIPVDLFGLPADYDAIAAIAQKFNLFVIEDAAQSFGGEYKGRKACSFGDIACTSFFPAKPLGGYGDGGMCFTDCDDLVSILRSLRVHGQGSDKYENMRIGINGRLDTIQAAILRAKFAIFPEEVELRQEVAKGYGQLLRGQMPGRSLTVPTVPPDCKSIWAQYSVLARNEEERVWILKDLKKAGIPTAIYYPRPLHLQRAFTGLGYQTGNFPVSEEIAHRIFSLPMHPYLSVEEEENICKVILDNKVGG
jgi:dTDP-4-amino-4,6-dideoxygalactose transaminase